MSPKELPYWSLTPADLCRRLETGEQGLADEDAHARLAQPRESTAATDARRHGLAAAVPVQEPDRSEPDLRGLAGVLPGPTYRRIDHPGDRPGQRPARLLAGARRRGRGRGAAGPSADQGDVGARRAGGRGVPVEEVVPGDLIVLKAGDIIPGDCLILQSKDLFLDEAALTGESFPAEKAPCLLPEETPLGRRSNSLFLGTHVVSGTARAIVVRTGKETEFSQISQRMALGRPETGFERGVRHFGYLLMEVTLILVIAIFAINVALARPVLDSFLFSLALAVGMTPQLLPAIVSVNLCTGPGGWRSGR